MPIKLKDIPAFFEKLRAERPNPQGELNYKNHYTLLVAVVLSAQATDKGVNKATGPLFDVADSPEKMVALGEPKVRDYVKSIGLYKTKAKNVIALSKRLIEEFDSEVPADRDVLQTLPGVGRKTANVVMNIAFGAPTMAVDTHIFRVSNRTGLAPGKDVLAVEKALDRRVPDEFKLQAHHWLILLGRYVCKARTPDCPRCVVRDICQYKGKTTAEAA